MSVEKKLEEAADKKDQAVGQQAATPEKKKPLSLDITDVSEVLERKISP